MKLILASLSFIACYATPTPTTSPTFDCNYSGTLRCTLRGECQDESICANKLVCEGEDTCTDVENVLVKNYYITGYGTLHESNIRDEFKDINSMRFYGASSGAYIAMKHPKLLEVFGPHNMDESSIHTTGLSKVESNFLGYRSFYSSIYTCSTGTECTVNCVGCSSTTFYVEEGAKLELNCLVDSACDRMQIYNEGESICISGPGAKNVKISPLIHRRLASKPSTGKKPLKKVKHNRELSIALKCRQPNECSNQEITDSDVQCFGPESCDGIYGNVETIKVEGYESFTNSYVEVSTIELVAYKGGDGSVIRPQSSNLVVKSDGYRSFINGLIICSNDARCQVSCTGLESCKGSVLDCSDTTESNCIADENEIEILKPCHYFDDTSAKTCNKQGGNVCAWISGECKPRHALCKQYQTSSECNTSPQKTYCTWDNSTDECKLRWNKTPSLYKEYNRYY